MKLRSKRYFSFNIWRTKIAFNLLVTVKIIIITLVLFSQFGCKKFIEIKPPTSEITSATVYSTNSSAAAVVTSIYENMVESSNGLSSGSYSISELEGLAADELTNYSNDPILSTFYSNSLSSINEPNFWFEIYTEIHTANAALEGLAASKGVTTPVKQQLTGELKFMRAFFHFYAINLFGDVPLVTTSDYLVNNSLHRSPQVEVYQQIIKDLTDAQSELGDDYRAPNNTITSERIRPNKSTAMALLARAYLYTGKWDSAEMQATTVINNSKYSLISNLDSVFLANSTETIWQLQPNNPGYNTFDAYYFVLTSPPGSGQFSVALSTYLLHSFEVGDGRFVNWIDSLTDPVSGITYYYPYKYKVNTVDVSQPVTEYLMVLRLAEQYLIRAEARAHQGNLQGAIADLNAIRIRAGLPGTSASAQSDILKAIYHERQVELFTEWGQRWFDLKRTGNINIVLGSPGNVCATKGGTWNPDWQVMPIPNSEILTNSKLTQNPGYQQ